MNISEATHCKFTADELLETIPKFLVANGGILPVWILGLDSIFFASLSISKHFSRTTVPSVQKVSHVLERKKETLNEFT